MLENTETTTEPETDAADLQNAPAEDNGSSAAASDATNESTTTDSPTAPLTTADIAEQLTRYYEQSNKATDGEETAQTTDTEVKTEEEELKPDTDDAEKESAEEESTEATDDAEDETESADFDALLNKKEAKGEGDGDESKPATEEEYPDLEAIKAKYPRQNKELYAETARFAEAAKAGRDAITRLGGDEFIEPLAEISNGLQTGDSVKLFSGIMSAGSSDALVKLTGDALMLNFVNAKAWVESDDPELNEIGKSMLSNVDTVLAARFGEGTNLAGIEAFTDLQKNGWLDAVQRWREQGFVDSDEWFELIEAGNQPEQFKTLQNKLREKETELEQTRAQTDKQVLTAEKTADAEFTKTAAENLEKVLNDVVWKTSVLRDVANDSAELKAEKQFFRDRLKTDAVAAFDRNAAKNELMTGFRRGDVNTLKYKQSLSDAVNDAVLQTREQTSIAERIIAKLYGRTRNGSLAQPKPKSPNNNTAQPDQQQQLAPTQTTEFAANKPKTVEEITADLEKHYLANGGG